MKHTDIIKEPYIGQVWTSTDAQFRINDMMITEDDAWVSYTNVKTLQEYSCRLEAFRQRFQPLAD
jgi:hypothetical protein